MQTSFHLQPSQEFDNQNPIELASGIFWVGLYKKGTPFQCHAYLLIDSGIGIVFDPGGISYFADVWRKIELVIDPKRIQYIVYHHQDPDLTSSLPLFEEKFVESGGDINLLKIITQKRTAFLIMHFDQKAEFLFTETLENKLKLPSGRELKFIHTPYMHAPGAIVTYDPIEKILFSSDIFGAVTHDWELWATEKYLEDVRDFHAEYMPSREILNYSLGKIEQLDLKLILPQHGSFLTGKWIPFFINNLKGLECGLYIDQGYRDELSRAQNNILNLNLKLEEINNELSRKNSELESFVYSVSHDLKSPLFSIDGWMRRLEKALAPMEAGTLKAMTAISGNLEKMFSLIEDLLELSRVGRILNPIPGISLEHIIHECLVTYEIRIQEVKGSFFKRGDFPTIDGDPTRLGQMLSNLFENSIKFRSPDRHLLIELTYKKGENGLGIISFKDNGLGIAPQYHQKIFEPFQKIHTGNQQVSQGSQGSGIGLALVKKIAESHNWDIQVDSDGKCGVEFQFYLNGPIL